MTTDEQYVPSEKAVRRAYTYYYDPATIRCPDTEQEFDRFLARVRRDAAREALDGLIADKAHMAALLYAENGGNVEDVLTHYRNSIHPEETP